MTTTTAFDALRRYLNADPHEVAETIYDCLADGAKLLDDKAQKLMMDFYQSFPDPFDVTIQQIAEGIEKIGTEPATQVAEELRGIIEQPF